MANIVDGMTERLLDDAGIAPGMRVLDIGCGPGVVSFMLARRVGEAGRVYGVDRDARMLAVAQARASELGLSNITFVEGGFDLPLPENGACDAAVGRRVLMYQPDPVRAIRELTRVVRPGGLVIFQEHDTVSVANERTLLPLHDRVRAWLREMLRREGANLHMGFALHGVLAAAGLVVEQVRAEANVLTPTAHYPVGAIIRSVLPRLVSLGVTTEEEIEVDTLDERLIAERVQVGATCVWELVFCAWARKPGEV